MYVHHTNAYIAGSLYLQILNWKPSGCPLHKPSSKKPGAVGKDNDVTDVITNEDWLPESQPWQRTAASRDQ
ncbi:hypothetical protein H4Q26_005540 [Puccinia striiformis f. sp. tritici PST-130]|nr:hypothetical protein H4Q26_005540 [Puccinia striiformis f. sp. tritici PST-130]